MDSIETQCIVCNVNFNSVNVKGSPNFISLLNRMWTVFCKYLDLSSEWQDILDSFIQVDRPFCPFCDKCRNVVAQLVVFEDKLEVITKQIGKVRTTILSTIIQSSNDSNTMDPLGHFSNNGEENVERINITKRVSSLRNNILQRFNPRLGITDCQPNAKCEENDDFAPIIIKKEPEEHDIEIKIEPISYAQIENIPNNGSCDSIDNNSKQDSSTVKKTNKKYQFEKIKLESEEEKRAKNTHQENVGQTNDDDEEDFDCTSMLEIVDSEEEEEESEDEYFDDPLYVPPSDEKLGRKRKLKSRKLGGKIQKLTFKLPPHRQIESSRDLTTFALPPKHSQAQVVAYNKTYPKPDLTFSCLAAMALRNSKGGELLHSSMCQFISTHFPYYRNAPSVRPWTESLSISLSSNPSFLKVVKNEENKGPEIYWSLNPSKVTWINEDLERAFVDHRESILISLADPENLPLMEAGEFFEEDEEEEKVIKTENNDDDGAELIIVEDDH